MQHPIRDVVFPLICISFLLGFGIGAGIVAESMRASAIQVGVAEWRCDPKTGSLKFEWIFPNDPK
jgi:hypothetical protein